MTLHEVEREPAPVFRRRRFAAPHRRRRLWIRLLRPLAMAVLIVGLPAGTAYWVVASPVFRVGDVAVVTGDRVPREWAEARLETLAGSHILLLGIQEIESRLESHPWFRGVQMSKRLPSHVEIRILERRAVALLRTPDELSYLDSDGRPIARYETGRGEGDFVIITAGVGESIRAGLDVANRWPEVAGGWGQALSEVESVDALSFRLHISNLDFPLLVTSEHLDQGVAALRRQLPRIRRRYPILKFADLRFSGQIVFQPAGEPPMEG